MIFSYTGLFLEATKGYTEALELGVQREHWQSSYRVSSSFLGEPMVGKGVRGGSRKGMRKRKGWFSDGLFENI